MHDSKIRYQMLLALFQLKVHPTAWERQSGLAHDLQDENGGSDQHISPSRSCEQPATNIGAEWMFVLHHEDHQDKAKGLDKGKTLNNLMTVNLQGPSISEFDPKEAVEHFMV